MRLFVQKLEGRTRCGLHNFINIRNQDSLFLPAVWEPWAMALVLTLPAAGLSDRTVINVAGDGCFRMNMNELATASRYQIPVIEVVVNNHVLGMVRQWQTLFYGERYSATVLSDSVDYVKVAEAMGVDGRRVTTQKEFDEAIQWAINLKKPVLIDCMIDPDDKVWPMVAPGASIADTFSEEDLDN